jgi:hypothetical protein
VDDVEAGHLVRLRPLSEQTFAPQLIVLTSQRLAGVAVAVCGLVGLAATVGYRVGRRPYRGSKNAPS